MIKEILKVLLFIILWLIGIGLSMLLWHCVGEVMFWLLDTFTIEIAAVIYMLFFATIFGVVSYLIYRKGRSEV